MLDGNAAEIADSLIRPASRIRSEASSLVKDERCLVQRAFRPTWPAAWPDNIFGFFSYSHGADGRCESSFARFPNSPLFPLRQPYFLGLDACGEQLSDGIAARNVD